MHTTTTERTYPTAEFLRTALRLAGVSRHPATHLARYSRVVGEPHGGNVGPGPGPNHWTHSQLRRLVVYFLVSRYAGTAPGHRLPEWFDDLIDLVDRHPTGWLLIHHHETGYEITHHDQLDSAPTGTFLAVPLPR